MPTTKTMFQDSGAMEYLLKLEQSRGIPAGTLSGIMRIESGGRANQVSNKGAKGYFQFTKATADSYGLKDPDDFQESARAAADYMKDNLKKYGTMDRALADYNGGPKAVAAYDAGKPFPETADYLQKFAGNSVKRGTRTSGEYINPADRGELPSSDNARFEAQKAIDKKFEDETYGDMGSRFVSEISNSVVPNSPLYAGLAANQDADPLGVHYQPSDEKRKEMEQTLPNQSRAETQYLYENATSDSHLMLLTARAADERVRAERQAKSGMGGVIGFNMAASMFDPVGLVLGGVAGKVFQSGRIANKALRIGAYVGEGATANAITESLFEGYNPQASTGDVFMAGAVGGVFGGFAGALSRHIPNVNVSKEAYAGMKAMDPPAADITPALVPGATVLNPTPAKAPDAEVPLIAAAPDGQVPSPDVTPETGVVDPDAPAPAPETGGYVPGMVGIAGDSPGPDVPVVADVPTAPVLPAGLDVPRADEPAPKKTRASKDKDASWDNNGQLNLPDTMNGPELEEPVKYILLNTKNEVLRKILTRVWKTAKGHDIKLNFLKGNEVDENMGVTTGGMHRASGPALETSNIFFRDSSNPQLKRKGTFGGREERTFIHELVHAVTVQNLRNVLDRKAGGGDPVLTKAVKDMNKLYLHARRILAGREANGTMSSLDSYQFTKYAMSNVREFVAVGLSDVNFQEWLRGIEAPGATVSTWREFTNAVRKLVGMDGPETDGFSKMLDLSDKIMVNHKWDAESLHGDNLLAQVTEMSRNDPIDGFEPLNFKDKDGAETYAAKARFSLEGQLGGSVNKIVRFVSEMLLNPHAMYKDPTKVRAPSGIEIAGDLTNAKKMEVHRAIYPQWVAFAEANKLKTTNVHEFNKFEQEIHAAITGLDIGRMSPEAQKAAETLRAVLADALDLVNDPGKLVDKALPGLTQRPYTPPVEMDVTKLIDGYLAPYGLAPDNLALMKDAFQVLMTKFSTLDNTVDDVAADLKLTGLFKNERDLKTMAAEIFDVIGHNEVAKRDFGKTMTDPLPKNPNYFPRLWDAMKMGEHGDDTFQAWLSGGIRAANSHLTDKQLDRITRLMAKKINEAKIMGMNDAHLQLGTNDLATLRHDLLEAGLSWSEISSILRPLQDKSTPGVSSPRLKHRAMIDEGYKMELNGKTYTLQDFVNTDVTNVLSSYHQRLHGDAVLAGKLGIYNELDIKKLENQIREEIKTGDNSYNKNDADKNIADIRYLINELRGVNEESWTIARGVGDIIRKAIFADLGGLMFTNSIGEMARIQAVLGWKSLRYLPAVMKTLRDAKTGELMDADLRMMEHVFGGSDLILMNRLKLTNFDQFTRGMSGSSPTLAKNLDTLDMWATKASNFVAHMGLNQVITTQKRWAYKAIVGKWRDSVMGDTDMGMLFKDGRLREWGMEPEQFATVNKMLKKHSSKVDGGKFSTDFDSWEAEDAKSFSQFFQAIHRQGSRIVLENDVSSSHPWLGTTVGGLMLQFRVFVVNSYDQSLMNAAHHRDAMAYTMFLSGAFGASMMYVANTYYRSIGRDDAEKYRRERLTAANIVKVGIFRTAEMSVVATINDTLNPFFKSSAALGRTTVQGDNASSILFGNPFMGYLDSVTGTGKILKNALSGGEQTNQTQVRDTLRAIPLMTVAPMVPIANVFISQFPTSAKQTD